MGDDLRILALVHDISERKNADTALRREHERLEFIIRGARLGTWVWNVQTNETVFNEIWAQLIGYSLEEQTPYSYETWKELVHPDDLPGAVASLQRCIDGAAENYESQHRMRHKDGHWVWILDRGRVMTRDEAGRPLSMFGTHTDITEQKQAETELAEKMKELKRFNKFMVGRELRMTRLKQEVNDLLKQLDRPPKYPVSDEPGS